jgi:FkbM family methyltransferase
MTMSFFQRVSTNLRDVRMFGPAILARHFGRLRKDGVVVVQTGDGPVHIRAGDSDIAAVRQVFGRRDYDISGYSKAWGRIQQRYNEILAQGATPVIVDAGANIGTATIWFKSRYPEAAVVAIEPDPGNAAVLRMNASALKNIHVMEAAIGSERGFVELVTPGLSWAVQTERAQSGIPIVTIDDALAQVPGGVPFIAKIDIEGFEADLFSTNLDWIGQMASVIIEPHDWMLQGQYSSVPFQRALGAHRFEMFHTGENIFYIR